MKLENSSFSYFNKYTPFLLDKCQFHNFEFRLSYFHMVREFKISFLWKILAKNLSKNLEAEIQKLVLAYVESGMSVRLIKNRAL